MKKSQQKACQTDNDRQMDRQINRQIQIASSVQHKPQDLQTERGRLANRQTIRKTERDVLKKIDKQMPEEKNR